MLSDIGIPSFPTVAQHIESPDVEKEVKRLLCSDAEAINARILLHKIFSVQFVPPQMHLVASPCFWYLCADVNVQNLELGVMLLPS